MDDLKTTLATPLGTLAATSEGRLAALAVLAAAGLNVGECIEHFAKEDADSAFVAAAREKYEVGSDNDVEIESVVSQSDNGAFVLGWLWVYNSEAEPHEEEEEDDDPEASEAEADQAEAA